MEGTTKYAIIVAGGKGLRMGSDIPKQFLTVQGRPLLMLTLENFHSFDPSMPLILVLPEAQQEYWERLCKEYVFRVPHTIVSGGETRFHSVRNGLHKIINEELGMRNYLDNASQAQPISNSSFLISNSLVAIHDGVRPFVSHQVIAACFEAAERDGAAIPVIPVVETLREVYLPHPSQRGISRTVNRNRYRLVQTPQTFCLSLLLDAYAQPYSDDFTDDASVVEALGHPITLVEGNRENIKITTPYDLAVAEIL